MIRTKYTYWAYLPLFLALTLIPLLYVFIAMIRNNSPTTLYLVLSGILCLCAWLIIVELGKKVVSISINEKTIKTANFLGLGSLRTIKLNEIDGFKISSTPYDWERFEVLYLN